MPLIPDSSKPRLVETRRKFIRRTMSTAVAVAGAPLLDATAFGQKQPPEMTIVVDSANGAEANSPPIQWAVGQLRDALKARGVATRVCETLEQVRPGEECVLVAGGTSKGARQLLKDSGLALPETPEAIGLARGTVGRRGVLLVTGSDTRGLVFGLLELADRVQLAGDARAALKAVEPSVERPANVVRSVARFFVSDVEDKDWFNDREFWTKYLTMLASERFNRFSLTLGIGYDFTNGIRDCYFHFPYPFLVSVPGYQVRAVPLPDEERDRNLEMLKFIGEETARRGLQFQLGLWTHAYRWTNSPRANYTIEGLTAETHGAYCRDALRTVLQACPAISGVTFRIHGESGVAEGSYEFWKTVFDGVVASGRKIEIDMHAKGMDQPTLDTALGTGMPVCVSPKFWAEHLGLPYMQADIRPLERPAPGEKDSGFFAQSSGARKFLRYGYGDLLAEDRRYSVVHRVWPGTQRLLLWGDPVAAAGYGRAFSFCGSHGVEICEPLSFKGRKGSGLSGGRDAYADESLRTAGGGWEKYLYTYRLWGRLTYNPEAKPETWRRLLQRQFGAAAGPAEAALGQAGRILPLITTTHCPSAANNNYWPEIYTNMSIADATRPGPYSDTMSPKRFGTVSPLDPELFSRIDDFAGELLKGKRGAKYSPIEVAQWLQDLAEGAMKHLADARGKTTRPASPEFRRFAVDVTIQSGLGLFFAHKFRAGVLYALFDGSGFLPALQESVQAYRQARAAWAQMAEQAKGVYAPGITFGAERQLRGYWPDRIAAIDEDIADLERRLEKAASSPAPQKADTQVVEKAIREVLARPQRPEGGIAHQQPGLFRRGEKVVITATLADNNLAGRQVSARLRYRHVNQGERWREMEMEAKGSGVTAVIGPDYTDSQFPLEYFFELRDQTGNAWIHPGFVATLANQPYFVVRQTKT